MAKGPGRPSGGANRQTRQFLLRVARQAMIEGGTQGATIRQIAGRADVNPALLHYYFGTKAGLQSALMHEIRNEFSDRVHAAAEASGSVSERIAGVLRVYLQALAENPFFARMLLERCLSGSGAEAEVIFSKAFGTLSPLIEEGIESGELRPVNATVLLAQLATSCLSLVLVEPLVRSVTVGQADTHGLVDVWAKALPEMVLDGIVARAEADGVALPTVGPQAAPAAR